MTLWDQIKSWLGGAPLEQRTFQVDAPLAEYIYSLAKQQQRPPESVVNELLASGLQQHDLASDNMQRWLSLSPRQKEVAALVCLGYTNPQIARRLVVTVDTVKAHMRQVLAKFSVHSRGELRALLQDWDFRSWEE